MKICVFIKDKKFVVEVGDGAQTLRWLADVANFRFRRDAPQSLAQPAVLRLENGNYLELEGRIKDNLKQQQNVWVILEDEYDGN
jgi:hypothetical protein